MPQKVKKTPFARCVVPNAAKISMTVLWVITPCGLASKYKYFGGSLVHLQGSVYRVSHKSIAPGEVSYLAKYGKI
jgi:hypothetical protein